MKVSRGSLETAVRWLAPPLLLAAIAIMLSACITLRTGRDPNSEERRLGMVALAVCAYAEDHGQLPPVSEEEFARALLREDAGHGPYLAPAAAWTDASGRIVDGFGRPYRYVMEAPELASSLPALAFELVSLGPDGRADAGAGGDDLLASRLP